MRSVTSCFNPTLYKKNLTRFWPLWTAWLVLWLFVLPLNLLQSLRAYDLTNQRQVYQYFLRCMNLGSDVTNSMLFFGVIYAVLIPMAVFGYLYNHRAAATIHALPMRRENLFITNYLSGLTFIVLPHVVVFGAAALVELTTLPAELSGFALGALGEMFWATLGTLFFLYSFAVFCAQFTGNILALPAFYGILNVLVIGMYGLITEMGRQIFFGGWPLVGNPAWVWWLTPVSQLGSATDWNRLNRGDVWNEALEVPVPFRELDVGVEDMGVVGVYALAAVVLAVLALLVYRRRHVETAGDVVSVKVVRPIFRIGVAVCVGLCGSIAVTAFFGWFVETVPTVLFVFVWTVVGYFVAEMLLQKSFRVFKKSWRGCVVTAAVLSALVLGCFLDVFGVETWVPKADKVEGLFVSINDTAPYDSGANVNLDLTDPVEIEQIVDLHQAIVDDYEEHGENYFGDSLKYVRVVYLMENGKEYTKRYNNVNVLLDEIDIPGTTSYIMDQFMNDPSVIDRVYGMETALESKVVCTELNNLVYPSGRFGSEESMDGAQEIWEAVQYDFAAGNLGKRYLVDDAVRYERTYQTDLVLRFLQPQKEGEPTTIAIERPVTQEYDHTVESQYSWNWTMRVTLTPAAERTLAAIEKYYPGLGSAYELAAHDWEK